MEDLNILRDKAYQNAVAHGWHDKEYSNEHWLFLVISELMGSVDADINRKWAQRYLYDKNIRSLSCYYAWFKHFYEKYMKDTMEDKLADACIRLFDYAGLRNIDLDSFEYKNGIDERFHLKSFTESIYNICYDVVNPMMMDMPYLFLEDIFTLCRDRNIDIMWHINEKMKYNKFCDLEDSEM